jgi:hypothetical protein
MHDLNNFGLKKMIICQSFLRQSGASVESMERILNILGEVKVDE